MQELVDESSDLVLQHVGGDSDMSASIPPPKKRLLVVLRVYPFAKICV